MFDAVVGHGRAKQLLEAALRGGPGHAYLIVGPDAVGKATLARTFAQTLTCEGSLEQRPCGRCRSCRLFVANAHPDYREVDRSTGAEERRTTARTTRIPIEAVRSLQHDAALTAHLGGRKVYLVVGADDLSFGAMDALLKTLEEPAPHVVLLLTATDVGLLPATIVSRCQVVKLGLIAPEEVAAALIERRGVDPERAELISHLAAGRPGRAFELAAEASALEERAGRVNELLALDAGSKVERLRGAEKVAQLHSKSPNATERWLELLFLWWRDVLLVRAGCAELVVNRDRLAELRRRASVLSVGQACRALRAIEQTSQYLDENVQARIALEYLLLSLPPAA